MKHAVLIALLLGPMVFEAPAQQSQSTVVVPVGPAPTANYVWVTLRSFNGVDIRRTDGTRVVPPLAGNGLNLPHDIVGIPSLRRVYISNAGAVPGSISVFDSDTLAPVGVVQVPNSRLLQGMSVSEDNSAIFVAGESLAAGTQGPSVFRFDPVTLAPGVRAAGTIQAGVAAEDCAVIRAANVGGSGDGPGKLYWSVRLPGTTGYIGIANFIGISPASLSTGQGSLINIELADNMERTPDHRFVFVGCNKRNPPASGPNCQIIRIDSLNDGAGTTIVQTGFQDLTNNRTFDVTWRVDGGANRGFVLLQQDNGTREVVEINDAGAQVAAGVPVAGALIAGTVRISPLADQLFTGETGTSPIYNFSSAPAGGALGAPTAQNATASNPFNFVVMPTPGVVISDITPRGGPAGALATIRGAGFQQTMTGTSGGGTPVGINWIDSNTATVDFAAVGLGLHDLVLTNPNAQQGTFGGFYQAFAPPAPQTHQLVLPSLLQGYQMLSVPQYASLTSLKAAFESTLGPYNPVLYRVFFFRNGQYVELNQLADDGCDLAGESFWVLTRNGAMVTLTEPDVRVTSLGSDRVVPLNPGFNMVSLPLLNGGGPTGSILWTLMHVTDDESNFVIGSPGGPVSVTSAQGLALVEQAVEYVNGSYLLAPSLIAGQGAWVRNLTTGPVYLVFAQGSVTKAGAPSPAPGVPPPAGSMPPGPPSGMSDAGSGSGGCGLLGLECALLVLLFALRRGRLGA